MKCEIDIDLGELADGWEPVAFREPLKGESYLSSGATRGSSIREAGQNFCDMGGPTESYLIVRRRWKWPEWLTAEWIAMDANGNWVGYATEPDMGAVSWNSGGESFFVSPRLTVFGPPPRTDWKQSKRRNPNAKATT